ncbi:hypothetical protein B0H13DRAFT_1618579 [Mycena leptocephala]|nr:hypothetical protein B0H13DRAFT_1618579 [Mycena leptocephala]
MPSEETVHTYSISPARETISPPPFSGQFLDKFPEASAARAAYLKILVGGVTTLAVVILAVFSIYWGSLWRTPHHTLPGWIVDFDGGAVGQAVSSALNGINPGINGVSWKVVSPTQFPEGISQLQNAIVQEKTWYAVAINSGASANLSAAVSAADGSYNSSTAITFMGSEARNENIYRIHSHIVLAELDAITHQFALQFIKNISSSNAATLLSAAPQLVARPIYYSVENLRPFDVAVASAVTLVGLIYLLILSPSLQLFYTLLSRAFQLPFDRQFGSAGFVVFWMLNWIGMLACGLALEAMITLLTARFTPFFLLLWIISNVSVLIFPLEVLPHVYRYGYAFPFYNVSRAVRSIVFRTKNDVGMNFGVLIAWVALSCITLPLFQWFMRRRLVAAQGKVTQI